MARLTVMSIFQATCYEIQQGLSQNHLVPDSICSDSEQQSCIETLCNGCAINPRTPGVEFFSGWLGENLNPRTLYFNPRTRNCRQMVETRNRSISTIKFLSGENIDAGTFPTLEQKFRNCSAVGENLCHAPAVGNRQQPVNKQIIQAQWLLLILPCSHLPSFSFQSADPLFLPLKMEIIEYERNMQGDTVDSPGITDEKNCCSC